MKFKNSSAFTLIELLVGISIIAIVFSIGVANYRDFARRESLNGIVKQIKGDLRTAQQLALSGKKPTSSSCDILNTYTFSLSGSSSYKIVTKCTSNSGVTSTVDYKIVNLDSNITISSPLSSIDFKVLGQGTNLSATNVITLTHVGGSQSTISVGVGGDVN